MGVENINTIANILLSKGANKNSIVGVLVNMGQESTWSPFADEKPGAPFYFYGEGINHGFGLVQYSYRPMASDLYNYAQTHSEIECIKNELNWLWDERGLNASNGASWASWIAPQFGLTDINSYWLNTAGLSEKECTQAWWACFERGGLNGYQRWNKFANVVNANLKWDGNIPEGGGSVVPPVDPKPDEPQPETPIRKLTLQECMAFIDKAKPQHNGEQQPDPIDPDKPPVTPPSGSSGNMQAVWDMYQQAVNAGLSYSWEQRNNFPYYGDCSSFVSRCVQTWLGLPINTGYTTETLHAYLKSIEYTCTYEGSRSGFPNSAPEGSVILMGRLGQSGGAGGHTVFVCDNNKTIEVSASAPPNQNYGISGVYSVDRLKNWHTSINYWYLYEKR